MGHRQSLFVLLAVAFQLSACEGLESVAPVTDAGERDDLAFAVGGE
jgi:hypothetical protein